MRQLLYISAFRKVCQGGFLFYFENTAGNSGHFGFLRKFSGENISFVETVTEQNCGALHSDKCWPPTHTICKS